ncbi:hypothetical protein JOF29_003816 [Kribbella aluminosa]|uniref:Uncharacterized protein n=1 Tax=Kribbella aluminosa TaxID=416017 RepID=A0ABS4UM52_9ACTN|nr:hypothetical protein [Kribbella aluminosa]
MGFRWILGSFHRGGVGGKPGLGRGRGRGRARGEWTRSGHQA